MRQITEPIILWMVENNIPVIITGSYASYLRGEVEEYSDIDIIVHGDAGFKLFNSEKWIPEPTVCNYPHFLWGGSHNFTPVDGGKEVDLLITNNEEIFLSIASTCTKKGSIFIMTYKSQVEYSKIEAGISQKKSEMYGFGDLQKGNEVEILLNREGKIPFPIFTNGFAEVVWMFPHNRTEYPSIKWQKWAAGESIFECKEEIFTKNILLM